MNTSSSPGCRISPANNMHNKVIIDFSLKNELTLNYLWQVRTRNIFDREGSRFGPGQALAGVTKRFKRTKLTLRKSRIFKIHWNVSKKKSKKFQKGENTFFVIFWKYSYILRQIFRKPIKIKRFEPCCNLSTNVYVVGPKPV